MLGPYWSEEYAVRRHWTSKIIQFFQVDADKIVDGFSTNQNRRFTRFITKDEDSLKVRWPDHQVMWLNPPWSLFPQVADKVQEEQVTCIIICPAWHSKAWVQQLLKLTQRVMYFEAGSRLFEFGGRTVPGTRWGTYAMYIPGKILIDQGVQQVQAKPMEPMWSKAAKRRWRRTQQWYKMASEAQGPGNQLPSPLDWPCEGRGYPEEQTPWDSNPAPWGPPAGAGGNWPAWRWL